MAGPDDGGAEFLAELLSRRERILRANPQAYAKITGRALPRGLVPPPRPRRPVLPVLEHGRYVSPTIVRLIDLVARHSDISVNAIRGYGRATRLVNARYCIANLAEEFVPRVAARMVDDFMLRGEGLCLYYRARHRDRLEMYEDYLALYDRCRDELVEGRRP